MALEFDISPVQKIERRLFYAGQWHAPVSGKYFETTSPINGVSLGKIADAQAEDVDLAVQAAHEAFQLWSKTSPQKRAQALRKIAATIRENSDELSWLDAVDAGNPITKVRADVEQAAERFDFFAGLITELKGETIPSRDGTLTYTSREPFGVVARIVAFNHPFMFTASRLAAPLAAGNTCLIKPPEQASLSGLRFAELIKDLLPAGVFSLITGGKAAGEALSRHENIKIIGLVGSVPTGKAVMRNAADTLKPVLLELGGKNALIACADADPQAVATAAIDGMNFTWCGQSCGSTSRLFLHDEIYEEVIARLKASAARYTPANPLLPSTTMGCLINHSHLERVKQYIKIGIEDGAHLLTGGVSPSNNELDAGSFLEPTIFIGVTNEMRIAQEEIFGPVLSVLRWSNFNEVISEVNSVPFGLTCSIFTENLALAMEASRRVDVGYVWINDVTKHIAGAPFGGVKQSGIGREESLSELYEFSREKTVHVNFSGTR